MVCDEKYLPGTTGQHRIPRRGDLGSEVSRFSLFLCTFSSTLDSLSQARCFLLHPDQRFSGRKKAPTCSICQFPWCKYSYYGLFQPTNLMSLNQLEICSQWVLTSHLRASSSMPLTQPDPVTLAWSELWTQLLATVH